MILDILSHFPLPQSFSHKYNFFRNYVSTLFPLSWLFWSLNELVLCNINIQTSFWLCFTQLCSEKIEAVSNFICTLISCKYIIFFCSPQYFLPIHMFTGRNENNGNNIFSLGTDGEFFLSCRAIEVFQLEPNCLFIDWWPKRKLFPLG